MTIDEAIAKYKEITSTDANCPVYCGISCDKCVQESEQLVEWLEELKAFRENKWTDIYIKRGYNKAIDDIKEKLMQNGFIYTQYSLDVFNEIAEQLKAGGENE